MDISMFATVTEAAKAKGVTLDAVRKRAQSGRLMAAKLGDIWVIDRGALDSWQPRTARKGTTDGRP